MRGDRLRALREAQGLTQEELALEVGSSEPQIWRYEKSENEPRADVLMRIAQFFNVSADYLLGLTDNSAMNINSELKAQEAAALDAWRRGERFEAIRVIVEDE